MTSAKVDSLSLSLAEQEFREAQQRSEELSRLRNDLIRKACAQGWTHARIAEATGLTRSRIGAIALARTPAQADARSDV